MLAIDEDLRHRPPTPGPVDHLRFAAGMEHDVDLVVFDTLILEQSLGVKAKSAKRRGINIYLSHHSLQKNAVTVIN